MRLFSSLFLLFLLMFILVDVPILTGSFPRTALAYKCHGFNLYVERRDGQFFFNGYILSTNRLYVNISYLTDSYAYIDIYVKGELVYYEPFRGIQAIPRPPELVMNETYYIVGDVEHMVRFRIDRRTNYAWLNETFIGFFPLFIFPPIGYQNVSEYKKYVYLGERLSLHEERGTVFTSLLRVSVNDREYVIPSLVLLNPYFEIGFVYHYPIAIFHLLLPINETTYLLFASGLELELDEEFVEYLLAISDYPTDVHYMVWERLPIVVGIFVAIFGPPIYFIYMVSKKRKLKRLNR